VQRCAENCKSSGRNLIALRFLSHVWRRPYGTRTFLEAFFTLKCGANKHCAYGALTAGVHALISHRIFAPVLQDRISTEDRFPECVQMMQRNGAESLRAGGATRAPNEPDLGSLGWKCLFSPTLQGGGALLSRDPSPVGTTLTANAREMNLIASSGTFGVVPTGLGFLLMLSPH
jgi:hypothetical protein